MNVKLVEPIKDSEGNFDYYTSESEKGVKSWVQESNEIIYRVKEIEESSEKYEKMMSLLKKDPCKLFIELGEKLRYYLKESGFDTDSPETLDEDLHIMTDFTDPRPMCGLSISKDDEWEEKENLFYLALNTEWDSLDDGEMEKIFGHEYSHLMLYLMNYDPSNCCSNKFHDVTAVTDPYTAFSEGFAEHLEIVSYENGLEWYAEEEFSGLWDTGLDIDAWTSYRSKQLRYHAVKNNRFVYGKSVPDMEDYSDFTKLHLDHLTSSAFLPEKVKNGNQVLASEGAVSSIFYHIYSDDFFKNEYKDDDFYEKFGISKDKFEPVKNLYLKILYVISKIDMVKSSQPMIDFIRLYGESFPDEKKDLYKLFLKLTHFTTVSDEAAERFGKHYLVGRRGDMEEFRESLLDLREFKENMKEKVLDGEVKLDDALHPQIWVENKDYQVPPCPWIPDNTVNYVFDLNTASIADMMSLTDMNYHDAKKMINIRKEKGGFSSFDDFLEICGDFLRSSIDNVKEIS